MANTIASSVRSLTSSQTLSFIVIDGDIFGDLNVDGVVNMLDLLILLENWR